MRELSEERADFERWFSTDEKWDDPDLPYDSPTSMAFLRAASQARPRRKSKGTPLAALYAPM